MTQNRLLRIVALTVGFTFSLRCLAQTQIVHSVPAVRHDNIGRAGPVILGFSKRQQRLGPLRSPFSVVLLGGALEGPALALWGLGSDD